MFTSTLTFALAGALLAGQSPSPAWESSYAQAQQRSASMQKPMAVFVGSGANGWSQIVRDEAPSAQVGQLLGEKYLCVYIDMTTPKGMKLAREFGMENTPGLVLSNVTGDSQAFWHAGKMTNKGLARYLQKYADPKVTLNGTATADAAAVGTEAIATVTPIRTTPSQLQAVANTKDAGTVITANVAPIEKVVVPATMTWQPTYLQAQKMSADMKKPMAIAFGSGTDGWTKIVRDAAPAAEVTQVLSQKYVCVFIDTATPAGKKVAQDFGITQANGIVLSDRAGTMQAFWHQGDMTNQSMVSYLTKYAAPEVVVRGTETLSTTRTSFYPSNEADATWGTSGSSYCPSCNNARGRR